MAWTAKINGEPIDIQASSKGELLRLLKSRGYISNYFYDKKRIPLARWVSKDIIDINGVDDESTEIQTET